MRGKGFKYIGHALFERITPAHAGKSRRYDIRRHGTWDHPRPCGEKKDDLKEHVSDIGSPPPMRGKGSIIKWYVHSFRITPAHAGKRSHTGTI